MKADAFGQTPGIVATLQDAHEFALRMLPCDRQHHFGQRGEIFAFQSQRADRILAMRAGTAAGFGAPEDVLTDARMTDVFDCPMRFHRDEGGLFVRLG